MPLELIGLAGITPLPCLLQDPHQVEGATHLPTQHDAIQQGHEPQRPGDDPGAGGELFAVDPEGIKRW